MNEFSVSITLALVLATFGLAGSLSFFSKKKVSRKVILYLISISAGFLLATIFSEMSPLVFAERNAVYFVLLGYLVLHFFTFVLTNFSEIDFGTHRKEFNKNEAWLMFLALLAVTFVEGLALGSSFLYSHLLGFSIFVVVLCKKIPEGITIVSVMTSSGREKIGALSSSVILGLSVVAGAMWASTFTIFSSILLPLSMGALLQITITDLIPKASRKNSLINFLIIICGVLLYYVFSIGLIKLGIV